MPNRKLLVQVLVAIILFTLIAVILEKEYTQEVVLDKFQKGLIFGLIYGVILWAREKFKQNKQ